MAHLTRKCLADLEAYDVVESYPNSDSDAENKAWFLRAAEWARKHPDEKSQTIAQAHAVFGRAKERGRLPRM